MLLLIWKAKQCGCHQIQLPFWFSHKPGWCTQSVSSQPLLERNSQECRSDIPSTPDLKSGITFLLTVKAKDITKVYQSEQLWYNSPKNWRIWTVPQKIWITIKVQHRQRCWEACLWPLSWWKPFQGRRWWIKGIREEAAEWRREARWNQENLFGTFLQRIAGKRKQKYATRKHETIRRWVASLLFLQFFVCNIVCRCSVQELRVHSALHKFC